MEMAVSRPQGWQGKAEEWPADSGFVSEDPWLVSSRSCPTLPSWVSSSPPLLPWGRGCSASG